MKLLVKKYKFVANPFGIGIQEIVRIMGRLSFFRIENVPLFIVTNFLSMQKASYYHKYEVKR